jgi:hypothetical protein
MKTGNFFKITFCVLLLAGFNSAIAQDVGFSGVDDISNILSLREQAKYMDEVITWRIENLLPGMMKKHAIDLWLIIDRENNKDPVAVTFGDRMFLGGSKLLYNTGTDEGVRRYGGGIGRVRALVEELDPQKIGINTSDIWNSGDGLTKALYDQLVKALGGYADRLVSAENLSNEWLETKTGREISVYRHVLGVTHDVISEAFSNKVIVPGVTTTEDVRWWIAQRFADLGMTGYGFSIEVQRRPEDRKKYGNPAVAREFDPATKLSGDTVIRRGDIVHSDIGSEYIGLNTDNQQHVYILRKGETDVPEGLKQALRNANRVQDIFMSEFVEGRSGNDITFRTLDRARAEGLKPMIYTHPIGYHQHSGGTIMGADSEFAQYNPLPKAEYPLHYNTVWSIELEAVTAVPEWDGIEVEISLEEEGVFTESEGAYFPDGHQTQWFIVH